MSRFVIRSMQEEDSLSYVTYNDLLRVEVTLPDSREKTVYINNSMEHAFMYGLPIVGKRFLNYQIRRALRKSPPET